MGRIIIANRHGDQTLEWDPRADTDEGQAAVRRAEEIIAEARARGCAISRRKVQDTSLTEVRLTRRPKSIRSSPRLPAASTMPPWTKLIRWMPRVRRLDNAQCAGARRSADDIDRPWLARERWPWFPTVALTASENAEVQARAADVARRAMGDTAWEQLQHQGYLDVQSRTVPGLTYRLRVGRRLQLIWDSPELRQHSSWQFDYLCVNPTYPLPAVEFTAQLFLYTERLRNAGLAGGRSPAR